MNLARASFPRGTPARYPLAVSVPRRSARVGDRMRRNGDKAK
jgi:hypothetical protein